MATKTVQCLCQSFEFGIFDVDSDADYSTGCAQTTTKVFAQGHDAKLVGYLVRAELAGEEIRRTTNGVVHTFHGPVLAAASISEALAAKTQTQLDAARARTAKKAAREAVKAAKASKSAERQLAEDAGIVTPEAPTTRESRIKVGRWAYDAVIDLATGEAHFFSKLGTAKTADQGTYSEV